MYMYVRNNIQYGEIFMHDYEGKVDDQGLTQLIQCTLKPRGGGFTYMSMPIGKPTVGVYMYMCTCQPMSCHTCDIKACRCAHKRGYRIDN